MATRSLDLVARLIADTKQLRKGMDDAEATVKKGAQRLRSAGRSAERLGASLSKTVTLPLLAVGAAAAKASIDFESTFAKMQGLAGVAASEVDGLKESVLGLAGKVGKGPQELAEALYFIRSAGVDGAAALETLENSAKAASAGLGSTVDVANAVTNALNAYGDANISAAQATDVLVETARQGKAEAADLAPQFGKLLPVASELGVTFDQVGAGLAFLSRTSGSAELSATLLSNVMAKLLKPSKQAIEILGGVGLTLEDVQKSIKDKGLLDTLLALRDQLPRDQFVKFFEDAQAVQGALALTGATADQAKEVFAALKDSTGATDSAFAAFAETAGFKNAQAFAKLQAAAIQIGDIIVPIISDIVSVAAELLEMFDSLPGPVKSGAVAFAALAAAAGPVLFIGGKLLSIYTSLPGQIAKAAGHLSGFADAAIRAVKSLRTMSGALNAAKFGATIGAAVIAVDMWNDAVDKQKKGVQELYPEWQRVIDTQNTSLTGAQGSVQKLGSEIERVNGIIKGSDAPWDADKRKGLEAGRDQLVRLRDETQKMIDKAHQLAEAQGISVEQAYKAVQGNKDLVVTQQTVVTEINGTAEAYDNATDAAKAYTDSLRAQFDPYFGLLDALQKNRDAQKALQELHKSGKATAAEVAAAQRDIASSALDVVSAAAALSASIKDGTTSLKDGKAALQNWVDAGLISEGQAKAVAKQMEAAAREARRLGDVDPVITVGSNVRPALLSLDQLARRMRELGVVVDKSGSNVTVTGVGALLGTAGSRAVGGPVLAGKSYLVGEKGPEVFSPSVSGTIIPNSSTSGGTTIGGTMNVTVYVNGDGDDVVAAIRRYERLNGASWRS